MTELRIYPEGDVIDLTRVRIVLAEVGALVEELDGAELDETAAIDSQTKSKARSIRAKRSQNLQLIAGRLELAAQLVRNEYWFARGEIDPLNPERGLSE